MDKFNQVNDISDSMVEISEVDQFCGNIVTSIEKMLDQLPPIYVKSSIYRVPKLLRRMNNIAYTPQVISIGPFHHHSRKNLIATKQYKLQGLANFRRRIDKSGKNDKMSPLKFLVRTAQPLVQELRSCYGEPINMNDRDFVKMMLVDGCFIVEFFILYYGRYVPNRFSKIPNNAELSFFKRIPDIDIDLIKLENQVPFSFLQRLFDLIPQEGEVSISFIELTYMCLQRGLVHNYKPCITPSTTPKHFVDFLSFYFILPDRSPVINIDESNIVKPPSITELSEAGVTIKKAEHDEYLMDIKFNNGVLEIPRLHLDDNFETMMRNLIAFEHFSLVNESYCMQYVTFMDYLINTEKDVSLLVKAEVILNDIGGNNIEVAELFNNLCKFVTVPYSYHFNDISKALKEHCSRPCNKAKATLKHDYFNTPCATISVLGASLIIFLTLLQTIFSGISAFPS